jgi:hypothetical protein
MDADAARRPQRQCNWLFFNNANTINYLRRVEGLIQKL